MTPEHLPKISVVTPSLNQGQFLEDTILSVLGQLYPRLEYFVMDGGSRDQSVEIIRRYESSLAGWVSEPDSGQPQAINKGFAKASGDILAWVNSDDLLMPGTLNHVAEWYRRSAKEPSLLYGGCLFYREPSGTGCGCTARPFCREDLLKEDFIYQPSAFWTRSLWEQTGPLNESLHFTFDWEWFIRASLKGAFESSNRCLSLYRIHSQHKTGSAGIVRDREILELITRFAPRDVQALFTTVFEHRPQYLKRSALIKRLSPHRIPLQGLIVKALFPALNRIDRRFGADPVHRCIKTFLYHK
jgi:hypothetical protein